MASCPRQDLAIHQAVAVLFGIEACLHTSALTTCFQASPFCLVFTQNTLDQQRQQHFEETLTCWRLVFAAAQLCWCCKCCLMCRYCGPDQAATEQYPFNPNGSPEGIAALCSPNGRHLAIMPHPERCFLMWQNPWFPKATGLQKDGPSPWLKLFQNAREWCESL